MLTKEKYPKVWELYKKYITSQVSSLGNKQVLDNLPVDNMIVASLSGPGMRVLYDLLDSNSVELSVSKAGPGELSWTWNIQQVEYTIEVAEKWCSNRIEAEKTGFVQALQILEDKL